MKIVTKDLAPDMWSDIETLFAKNGACGGCWCMSWRKKKNEEWDQVKGKINKSRFKRLVVTGKAHGVLAYSEGKPIGWCSYDKRTDFEKLERSPSLKCDDSEKVWSIPCFYIKEGYRGKGVASSLLRHALKALKINGAEIVEGYPVKAYKYGDSIPAAFAWTGTQSLFKKAGFSPVGPRNGGKQRMRKTVTDS